MIDEVEERCSPSELTHALQASADGLVSVVIDYRLDTWKIFYKSFALAITFSVVVVRARSAKSKVLINVACISLT